MFTPRLANSASLLSAMAVVHLHPQHNFAVRRKKNANDSGAGIRQQSYSYYAATAKLLATPNKAKHSQKEGDSLISKLFCDYL